MLRLFLGTCEAVRAMHTYVLGPSATYPPNASTSTSAPSSSSAGRRQGHYQGLPSSGRPDRVADRDDEDDDDDDEDDERHVTKTGNGQEIPLIGRNMDVSGGEGEVEEENDERHIGGLAGNSGSGGAGAGGRIVGRLDPTPHDAGGREGEVQPWAHRDIKPGTLPHFDAPPPFSKLTGDDDDRRSYSKRDDFRRRHSANIDGFWVCSACANPDSESVGGVEGAGFGSGA
jgi:serine/threonine kinase 16